MLQAQLRDKLPIASDEWRRNEDMLTSAVFGTLKNLPDEIAAGLLATAQPLFGGVAPRLRPPLDWSFWPWWPNEDDPSNGCEPDVAVSDAENLCVIEAKLDAPFGSALGKRDQLDREWVNGQREASKFPKPKLLWLVTVTAHLAAPRREIEAQLAGAGLDLGELRIGWLSWDAIARYLGNLPAPSETTRRWLDDLLDVLRRIGVGPFSGFDDLVEACSGVSALRAPTFWMPMHALRVGYGDVIMAARSLSTYRETLAWIRDAL
jgi:hypothetical protein